MQVTKVGGLPVARWLAKRIEKLSDTISFSTDQQAMHYALHQGLSESPGTKIRFEVRTIKKRKGRVTLTYANDPAVPWGPAFFPDSLEKGKDVKFGKTKSG